MLRLSLSFPTTEAKEKSLPLKQSRDLKILEPMRGFEPRTY